MNKEQLAEIINDALDTMYNEINDMVAQHGYLLEVDKPAMEKHEAHIKNTLIEMLGE